MEVISTTDDNWLKQSDTYKDVKDFCKFATPKDVYVLSPEHYVGISDEEEDCIHFEKKIDQLTPN